MKKQVPTKLQQEKQRKRLIHEEVEKLEVLGQESEKKAKKWIIEEGKKSEKRGKEAEAAAMDILWSHKSERYAYKRMLLNKLYSMIAEIDWPYTYEYGVWFDGKGIVVAIKDRYGKLHKRAFIPSHEPKYDLNACFRFSIWAENILDLVEGSLNGKGEIWLPSRMKN
jgi:hypothetical protein